jgi:DNA polymerase II large subunit
MSKKVRLPVVCLECGKKFRTTNPCPSCPKCGGSDVDLDD